MLSYQHSYHAGCYADVVKHLTLMRIFNYMTNKEKPLVYIDTHAGRGLYDLQDKHALKTGEARQGIALLWEARNQLPAVFSSYIAQIERVNTGDALRYYPGSPILAMNSLRKQDRLLFSELHPTEFTMLETHLPTSKRVGCNNTNGLELLIANLPPLERRGLIFLDPSYEIKTEYRHVPEVLKEAYQRFATGVYCLWYPIVDNKLHSQLHRGLEQIKGDNKLCVEFYLTKSPTRGMTGCGLWILNPPYVLKSELKQALETLCQLFNPGVSSFIIEA